MIAVWCCMFVIPARTLKTLGDIANTDAMLFNRRGKMLLAPKNKRASFHAESHRVMAETGIR